MGNTPGAGLQTSTPMEEAALRAAAGESENRPRTEKRVDYSALAGIGIEFLQEEKKEAPAPKGAPSHQAPQQSAHVPKNAAQENARPIEPAHNQPIAAHEPRHEEKKEKPEVTISLKDLRAPSRPREQKFVPKHDAKVDDLKAAINAALGNLDANKKDEPKK